VLALKKGGRQNETEYRGGGKRLTSGKDGKDQGIHERRRKKVTAASHTNEDLPIAKTGQKALARERSELRLKSRKQEKSSRPTDPWAPRSTRNETQGSTLAARYQCMTPTKVKSARGGKKKRSTFRVGRIKHQRKSDGGGITAKQSAQWDGIRPYE